ncbi:HpcH/HpaI aldolase family protein [Thermoanaerobacterium thermosaccharolyticum]|uniref:HpcH/HpaI aldolase family protein n=1 Tax=Thermoanaerobacterium thermosaccharolyticum TaxID=1517 RepID=UPI0020A45125|nr:aldolase/citrate lyase family protein [Thermoanaerobacterium thermosaccharolyticum]MCP2238951.1 4-hydroxy-2-oxoheptanedioate aldolase [Thermoanaerobacterium thermosaccharolyticum]
MIKNKLKDKLKNGDTAIGTFVMCNSPEIVEIVGITGFDFVVLDTEHGPLSIESTQNLIRAAEVRGITPITRITESSETTVLRSLDVGAYGIQVPQVNDAHTASEIVKFSKYYPKGIRGIAMPRSGDYGNVDVSKYIENANDETIIIVHCENKQSLDNLDEIAKVPGIDVIFLGPYDMSQSLGIPGQVNHPYIQEAAQRVIKVCRQNGIAAGTFVGNGEEARKKAEQGFQYIIMGMDVTLFSNVCKYEISRAKSKEF